MLKVSQKGDLKRHVEMIAHKELPGVPGMILKMLGGPEALMARFDLTGPSCFIRPTVDEMGLELRWRERSRKKPNFARVTVGESGLVYSYHRC
jgi:hypothetical protein